jgi:lysozyme
MQILLNAGAGSVKITKHYEQGPKGGHAEKPYLCPAGKWTIGYGHVILPGEDFAIPMSEKTASELLFTDLDKFDEQVKRLLKREPTQQQLDALVSFAFNTGVGKADGIKGDFADSDMLRYFNEGKLQLCAAEFGKWVYATVKGKKVILQGLVYRRKTEAGLLLSGDVVFYN